MQCDICSRTGGLRRPFLCPIDARNCLYETRFQYALVLHDKDAINQKITAAFSLDREMPRKNSSAVESTTCVDILALRAGIEHMSDRTQKIILKADELRERVEKARQELSRKKTLISRRNSDLTSASQGLEAWIKRQIDELENSIKMIRFKWHHKHVSTMSARAFLCGEAARLYGLKKIKHNNSKDEYKIGGIPIMDLRRLNTATAAQISTALSQIAHLLILSAHYLGIRLPAEITLPHPNYPLPTILPLQSSYKFPNLPFPSHTPTPINPSASRNLHQPYLPRPRPLFIRKPLPVVATEDHIEYLLFIEGISLLAYNIAWVCQSQGITLCEDGSLKEIYDIGRNLFNFLIGVRSIPSHENQLSSAQSTPHKDRRINNQDTEDRIPPGSSLVGKYSHSTAHSFLGNSEGTKLIRSWKLPNPIKLADRLRSQLMSEVANAEWEILDADACAANDDQLMGNDSVPIGQKLETDRGLGLEMQSFVSIKTVKDAAEPFNPGAERKAGTSGWTKLKPR